MAAVHAVTLTHEEQALFDGICWDIRELKESADRRDHLKRMQQLAESLLARNAIPAVRLAFFTDPEMNIRGHGKSHEDVFETHGTCGAEILGHPHFMPYLRYFILGPALPDETIRAFCRIIEDDVGTSGELLDQLTACVRKEVRDNGLSPGAAADEFFKLAHELGEPTLARSVRAAALAAR